MSIQAADSKKNTLARSLSKLKVNRTSSNASTASDSQGKSAYMSEESTIDEYKAPTATQKLTQSLSRSLSSAKYATMRSAKGIKIGAQDSADKVGNALSRFKKTSVKEQASYTARAVPVV